MADVATSDGWERLASALIARRVALGFHRRSDFVRARNLKHSRTVDDLENGRRANYEPSTIAHMELAYRWAPGSFVRVMNGEAAVDLPEPPQPIEAISDVAMDPDVLGILRKLADPDLSPEQNILIRQMLRSLADMPAAPPQAPAADPPRRRAAQ